MFIEELPQDLPDDLDLVVAGVKPPFLDQAIQISRDRYRQTHHHITPADGLIERDRLVLMTHQNRCKYLLIL